MESEASSARRFLPEIEGLRAVAAFLVAVYHVFLGRVSGGVDVFFLIAGFLITTSLVGRLEAAHPSSGPYFSRLAVRLLPISMLVLIVVAGATALWMPVTRQPGIYEEVAASALYVENWTLADKAVDYTARAAARSPVQHFWAMSVQGQFYLAWFAVLGTARLLFGPRRFRRALGPLLVALWAGSLAFSVYLTDANQPLAYFHTFARLWEFAAGGLLALALPRMLAVLGRGGRPVELVRAAAGWLGLAMIVSCGLLFSVSASFPGCTALWPIAGAALVVAAAGTTVRFGPQALLASRPLVFAGGVAYALYLWHWPLLIFTRMFMDSEGDIGLVPGAAVIGTAFALAVITTRLVETPIRTRLAGTLRPWRTASAGVAVAIAVALGAQALALVPEPLPAVAVVQGSAGTPAASGGAFGAAAFGPAGTPVPSPAVGTGGAFSPSGAAADPGVEFEPTPTPEPTPVPTPYRGTGPFVPSLREAAADKTGLHNSGCQQQTSQFGLIVCVRGDANGKTTALLIGGSHATQWYPALQRIARQRGWRLETAVKGSCRINLDQPFDDDMADQSCAAWLDELMAYIRRDPPDLIVTTSTVTTPTREYVPDGYVKAWRRFARLGIPVVAIRDTPRATFDRVDCLARHADKPQKCDIPRSPTLDPTDPAAARGDLPDNVILVDVNDYICSPELCPAVVGNVIVYRDRHHLTSTYAETLAPMLADQIPANPRRAVGYAG